MNGTGISIALSQSFLVASLSLSSILVHAQSAGTAPLVAAEVGNAVAAAEGGAGRPASGRNLASGNSNPSCSGGMPPPVEVRISAGKSTLVNLAEPIVRRTLGDPAVVTGRLVNPQILYLVSGRIGTTNAILEGVSGRCVLLDISVAIDTASVLANIRELMPQETEIRVSAAADSVVLSGVVSDAMAAEQAVSVANAYVRAAYQQGFGVAAVGSAGAVAQAGGAPLLARVVNMMAVKSAQQVMLEVKVAEVSKTILDKLGSALDLSRSAGSFTYRLLADFLSAGSVGGSLGATGDGDRAAFDFETRDGLVRVLAEPNVMAISGQEGSFLAGGAILIPTSRESDATGRTEITLVEKEFGVGLTFRPTVLNDGRINLQVKPEVSELSREGVGLSTTAGVSAVLPLITTRRAETTVQLYDGQSFAIGGLMRSQSAATVRGVPGLSQLPILGSLFRSTDFQADRTELVFIVTPRLVKPLPPDFGLPTDYVGDPSRSDLMLFGRLDTKVTEEQRAKIKSTRAGGMILK